MDKSEDVAFLREFYTGKKVLVTGVHGFKGSWLAMLLHELGAEVVGYGVHAEDGELFRLLDLDRLGIRTHELDVRDREFTDRIVEEAPDVAFHLAAQPIVSVGYSDPYYTYSTNVLGVVNFLEGIRSLPGKVSVVNITTDKVYLNVEKEEPYVETDHLMGEDPYSASKSCSELVSFSYRTSYFTGTDKVLSTARAGNVIGGGDFALNRIIPDMARAVAAGGEVTIRNFDGVRPYEHVLDALYAYVLIAARQWENPGLADAYNVGPNTESIMKTRELTDYFQKHTDLRLIDGSEGQTFHEANLLSLDSNKLRETLGWAPTWASKEDMLSKTLDWYLEWIDGANMTSTTLRQVKEFLNG